MNLALVIYVVTVLSNLSVLGTILIFTSLVILLILGLACGFGEWREGCVATFKCSVATLAVGILLSVFLPSPETSYKIIAAYGAQTVAENPEVQEILGRSVDILKLTLSQYKESLEAK